jgi:hypothetical protein
MLRRATRARRSPTPRCVKLVNGPEAFTPDGSSSSGDRRPRVLGRGGFCAHGLGGAGGMGQLMAEWIVEGAGASTCGTWTRAASAATTAAGVHARAHVEVYATYYDIQYPGQERQAGGPLRVSPAYDRLERSAPLGREVGWERPNWFESERRGRRPVAAAARAGPGEVWSPAIGAEHRAAGSGGAVRRVRPSPRSRWRRRAPRRSSAAVRERRRAAARPRRVHVRCSNERGGIECDVTVTRLARTDSGSSRERRSAPRPALDPAPMRREDGSVHVRRRDVAPSRASAVGPAARTSSRRSYDADLSSERFPTSRPGRWRWVPFPASPCG